MPCGLSILMKYTHNKTTCPIIKIQDTKKKDVYFP